MLFCIYRSFFTSELLPRLLEAAVKYSHGQVLEAVLGLITRLVLGSSVFIDQFMSTIDALQVCCLYKFACTCV